MSGWTNPNDRQNSYGSTQQSRDNSQLYTGFSNQQSNYTQQQNMSYPSKTANQYSQGFLNSGSNSQSSSQSSTNPTTTTPNVHQLMNQIFAGGQIGRPNVTSNYTTPNTGTYTQPNTGYQQTNTTYGQQGNTSTNYTQPNASNFTNPNINSTQQPQINLPSILQLLSSNPQLSAALVQTMSIPNTMMGNNTNISNNPIGLGIPQQTYNSSSPQNYSNTSTNTSNIQRSKSNKTPTNIKKDSRRRDERPIRKRTKSPPKKRSLSPIKKREETKKRTPSPPPGPKYEYRSTTHSFVSKVREYLDLKKRYSDLTIPGEFGRAISHWTDAIPTSNSFPIDKFVEFECDNETRNIVDHEDQKRDIDAIDYHIKVMPCTGIKNTSVINKHLARQIEFLIMRKKKDKTELLSIGGPLDVKLDGEPSEESFKRCAIRHAKDLLELDLSSCKNWWKFLEVQYLRKLNVTKEHKQITIIYLVSVWDAVPTRENFVSMWEMREKTKMEKNHQKKLLERKSETDAPPEPEETPVFQVDTSKAPHNVYIYTSAKREKYVNIKCTTISLDGLLDYNTSDDTDVTFEVSLFAENFHEMLQRDFGIEIYNSLMNYNPTKKRKREDEDAPNKKRKIESSDKASNDEAIELEITDKIIEKKPPVETEKQESTVKVINDKLLRAFHYFDRNKVGYIKIEDFSNMLQCLGVGISKNLMNILIDKIADGRRIKYNDIIEVPIN